MEGMLKEVYFDNFCSQCVHKDTDENEEPCCDCLEVPGRPYSHTPEYFERKENKGSQQ